MIDLADDVAADCYEVPARVAERVHLLRPADVFPHVGGRSRAVWSTPHGHVLVTDGRGTHRSGPPAAVGASSASSAGERRLLDLVWLQAA